MGSEECGGKCPDCPNAGAHQDQGRRTILSWIAGGGALASVASFLYPVIKFLIPPLVTEAAVNEASGGKVGELKPNSGKIIKFGSKPALLVRVNDTEYKAFSAVCTHLNCTVQYRDTNHNIWCACHNGTYDLSGKVIGGPPPAPLEEYVVNLRGEEIVVTKKA
jgi:Rieske Fe-S protein